MSNWSYTNIEKDPEVSIDSKEFFFLEYVSLFLFFSFFSQVGAVLCGFDINVNYLKYAKAFNYLETNPECLFLQTNDDPTFSANDILLPAGGSIAALLVKSLGRKPDGILGKPNKLMLDCIDHQLNLNLERTCVIGDSLDADILFGINCGIDTLLVLTGKILNSIF